MIDRNCRTLRIAVAVTTTPGIVSKLELIAAGGRGIVLLLWAAVVAAAVVVQSGDDHELVEYLAKVKSSEFCIVCKDQDIVVCTFTFREIDHDKSTDFVAIILSCFVRSS